MTTAKKRPIRHARRAARRCAFWHGGVAAGGSSFAKKTKASLRVVVLPSQAPIAPRRLTDDLNTRLVASKIIELAQRGVHDAPIPKRDGTQRVQDY